MIINGYEFGKSFRVATYVSSGAGLCPVQSPPTRCAVAVVQSEQSKQSRQSMQLLQAPQAKRYAICDIRYAICDTLYNSQCSQAIAVAVIVVAVAVIIEC